MGRNKNRSSLSSSGKPGSVKTKAVDFVTGKETIQYFFDPSLLLSGSSNKFGDSSSSLTSSFTKSTKSKDWNDIDILESKFLFVPCTIIKRLDDESEVNSASTNSSSTTTTGLLGQPIGGPTLVKTEDGTLHKISDSTKLIALHAPDDYIGVDDVLHLPNITEASLLHTLRLRYKRDEVYTQAGQILISINPYKNLFVRDGSPSPSESIYSENQMMKYRLYSNNNNNNHRLIKSFVSGTNASESLEKPHLFQLANRAFTALMDSAHSSLDVVHMEDHDAVMELETHHRPGQVINQSIIISGESGAGKTEATKIIMQFLARITRAGSSPTSKDAIGNNKPPDRNSSVSLEDLVLSCNPLLEAFGNAQTLRNNNSSRFGKFIHIDFSTETGSITGASISNYLLEKTRITTQVDGERNYHIFYQLLAGAQPHLLEQLGLQFGSTSFRYLGNRPHDTDGKIAEADAKSFVETTKCLTSLGLSKLEQEGVFSIAAAVLHLGNIEFEEKADDETNNESAQIKETSMTYLAKACDLIGLDQNEVAEAILTKSINVNGKLIKKAQRVGMAEDKRDALAKTMYSSLFVWLVKCVNDRLDEFSTQPTKSSVHNDTRQMCGFIGVLDIYGFEVFDTNGFEQLLINYCNEKLQRHFNRHLFEVEQDLYMNEGVDWSYISFNDNRPCLELIEGGGGTGGIGILNTLDDAWGGMGPSSEKEGKFVTQLHKMFGNLAGSESNSANASKKGLVDGGNGHPNFITPKFGSDRQFLIKHYAGEVRYTADGFVEKNMETLSNELRELGENATAEIPKRVYSLTIENPSQRSTIRGTSVGSQFRTSLQSLVSELESTQPHYIRCIKPNSDKLPSRFTAGDVLKQLRYSGMMEAIRIRQEGYALREDHKTFYDRFRVLLTSSDTTGNRAGIIQLVQALSKWLCVSDADWQVGHSKIFLRRELAEKLERLAALRVLRAARTICNFASRIVRRRLSRLLVDWTRFRLRQLKKKRARNASNVIGSTFRSYRQRRIYKRLRMSFTRIQAYQRRKKACARVRKLRDPFCDMSYRECRQMRSTVQSNLDKAVKEKDFRKAALLEAKIASIEQAIERKKPLTRAVVDKQIADIENQLEDAIQRKAFTECAPLQDKLEELWKKQAELPTIEELRSALQSAEEKMTTAARNRDFVGAAEAQAKVDEAKQKLADVLSSSGDDDEIDIVNNDNNDNNDKNGNSVIGCESRLQLEADIVSISQQIQEAINVKDFSKASMLQPILDEREKMRRLFPSYEELLEELAAASKQLDDAIAAKDFAKAGSLSTVVEKLEKKIELEKPASSTPAQQMPANELKPAMFVNSAGKKVTFDSRHELDTEILKLTDTVAECVKQRDFKKADQLQADVDKIIALRELLPSLEELKEKVKVKKALMDKAVEEKKFSVADELNSELEQLEKCLQKELSLTPKSDPVTPGSVYSNDSVNKYKVPSVPFTAPSNKTRSTSTGSVSVVTTASKRQNDNLSTSSKPVAKLRPATPLTTKTGNTILDVARLMASKRASACVIVNSVGGLAGIITDTDITRRVVAKRIDIELTAISEVMTPNPTCVSMQDSAIEALMTMVENRFRHLPVTDSTGSIVGLLDMRKCLNDAITKLENVEAKGSTNGEHIFKQALQKKGASAEHATAVLALLGDVLFKAKGNTTVPSLRSIVDKTQKTIVHPETTVREAGVLMAETRKPALVIENGILEGIVTFKDVMTRAVSKALPLDNTNVRSIMTAHPETVSPDTTALEALQVMHDHHLLTLPVCENDGRVLGLVDVMDVLYSCGGLDGWRSIFGSAMDIQDDVSEVSSLNSSPSKLPKVVPQIKVEKQELTTLSEKDDSRPVSFLRPTKPILSTVNDSILKVAKNLALKRISASLVTASDGSLAGILTDTDITRRVVAKYINPDNTPVFNVMTKNPTCVTLDDPATEAITTMIEKNFRHLPVVDANGMVVGLIDIAKCLNSVIGKLERLQEKNENSAEDIIKKAISAHGAVGKQADALQLLLGNVLSSSFGEIKTLPNLRTLLGTAPRTVVGPDTSVRDAGLLMAERRQAALVVDDGGRLTGLFGFKDMMTRVIAKERSPDTTKISEVMTPNPESVSPDTTVLEALQIMHDHKFLTLPVCEDDGCVLGIVNVMDVILGCGGTEGWRSLFQNMMEMTDDLSDSASVVSTQKSVKSSRSGSIKRSMTRNDRSVARLRPSKPLLSVTSDSILTVTKFLQQKRGSASLIVDGSGNLTGIVTDTDITRRVIALHIDPSNAISGVMTKKPTCVKMSDSATDALTTMVENHFRHLPVVDDTGSIVGLLDIAKCLNDAITKLEAVQSTGNTTAVDAVRDLIGNQDGKDVPTTALQTLLSSLLLDAFGVNSVPSLRSLLADKPTTSIAPTTNIREAAILMAERKKAALIVDKNKLIGLVSFKDMMSRAVANELDLEITAVAHVMTPEPETVSPDITVLEALQIMHDHKILTLPVCESDGTVLGLVDVMDVIYGCGGTDGWRSIFASAMDLDDVSVADSAVKSRATRKTESPQVSRVVKSSPNTPLVATVKTSNQFTPFTSVPPHIPKTLEFEDNNDHESLVGSTIYGEDRTFSKPVLSDDFDTNDKCVTFKVSGPSGSTHRLRCEPKFHDLLQLVSQKINLTHGSFQLQYEDDEGDTVVMTSDDDVAEAWNITQKAGNSIVKLTAIVIEKQNETNMQLSIIAACGLALVGLGTIAMMRTKKS